MPIGSILGSGIADSLEEAAAKRNLEHKLGRKVSTLELSSIKAYMEADQPSQNVSAEAGILTPGTISVPITKPVEFSPAESPMTTMVQLIPLAEADRLILAQKRNKQLILIPVFAFAALVSLLLTGAIQSGFTTVFFLLLALSTVAKAVHSLASVIRLNRDLRAGQKRVISALVEDQNMDVSRSRGYGGSEGSASYVFWVKAGGYKIPVTEEHYYRIKKGDLVDAYLAPNSGTFFGVSDRSTGEPALAAHVAPPLPPAKPRGKLTLALFLGGAAMVALLVVGAAALVVLNMPEVEYNRLNPFSPKPPRGAFPATIAGFTLSSQTDLFNFTKLSEDCWKFSAYYNKANRTIGYSARLFSSAEEAKHKLDDARYGDVVPRTDSQLVRASSYTGSNAGKARAAFQLGPYLIELDGNREGLIDFENSFPYAAYGVTSPTHLSLTDIKEKAIPAVTFLEEFGKDKAAAAKYEGQTLLFSGTVAAVSHSKDGKPLVALQKPGTTVSLSNILSCSFKPSEEAKVSLLKNGQEVTLRGQVHSIIGVLMIDDCELDSDSSTPSEGAATNASTTLSLARAKRGEVLFRNLLSKDKGVAPKVWGMVKAARLDVGIAEDEWQKLSKEQRVDLTHYAESLIPKVHANPEPYASVAPSDKYYKYSLQDARNLCATCWSIVIGPMKQDGSLGFTEMPVQGDIAWEQNYSSTPSLKQENLGRKVSNFRQQNP